MRQKYNFITNTKTCTRKIINQRTVGFTLIELLVVISIIALLMSILMPSLNAAKKTARRIRCGSNMRQLMVAWHCYSTENEDTVMPGKDYTPHPTEPTWTYRFWSGAWVVDSSHEHNGYFVPEAGFLWKYTREDELRACPSFSKCHKLCEADHGQLGYGYNFRYLSPQKRIDGELVTFWTKLSKIATPAQVVAFGDCSRNQKNAQGGWVEEHTPFLNPTRQQYPSFKGRHKDFGNVAWVDGHVSTMKPVLLLDSYDINRAGKWSLPKKFPESLNIGDLDKDGNPDTDDLFKTYETYEIPNE